MPHIPRLYIAEGLKSNQPVNLAEAQSHHLRHVLRLPGQSPVRLFNASSGEWEAVYQGKTALPLKQLRSPQAEADLWLLFAPLKKEATDFLIEKATEIGVMRFLPILSDFSQTQRINQERMIANAIAAAEQCGRLSVPTINELLPLEKVLNSWPPDRALLTGDESGEGLALRDLPPPVPEKTAFLIGPEGGFSEEERKLWKKFPFLTRINLGPRLLRAETAAIAALSAWQALYGDGVLKPF